MSTRKGRFHCQHDTSTLRTTVFPVHSIASGENLVIVNVIMQPRFCYHNETVVMCIYERLEISQFDSEFQMLMIFHCIQKQVQWVWGQFWNRVVR